MKAIEMYLARLSDQLLLLNIVLSNNRARDRLNACTVPMQLYIMLYSIVRTGARRSQLFGEESI
jgi:hypothetical protein